MITRMRAEEIRRSGSLSGGADRHLSAPLLMMLSSLVAGVWMWCAGSGGVALCAGLIPPYSLRPLLARIAGNKHRYDTGIRGINIIKSGLSCVATVHGGNAAFMGVVDDQRYGLHAHDARVEA